MRLPNIGEVFEGRYELLDILGEGAFARVYRASDRSVHRIVALKILSPSDGEYAGVTGPRFLREARLLAELQDPHTITMFDHGESPDGLLWMACEFVEGEDLRVRLAREGRLSPRVVRKILLQLLSSLQEAHGKGLLHRDIKPANILVHEYAGDPYRVKLLDFGLAKSVDADATQVTREGRAAGTPRYMSPEQVVGSTLGPPSDLYSLGLVAYELLTGAPAIEGPEVKDMLRAHLMGRPVVVPGELAPTPLRRIIERMADKDPESRYRTAAEVRRELKAVRLAVDDQAVPRPSSEPRQPGPAPDLLPDPGDPTAIVGPVPSETPTAVRPTSGAWSPALLVGAGALAAVLAVALVLSWSNDDPSEAENRRSAIALLKPAEPRPSDPAEPDVAPAVVIEADVGPPDMAPETFVTPTNPPDAISSRGCSSPAPFDRAGRIDGTLTYLPQGYDANVPHPLLIVMHADLIGPKDLLAESELIDVADEHGLVLSLPTHGGTADARVWRTSRTAVEFIEKVRRQVLEATCVDESRIFVVMDGDGGRPYRTLTCKSWVRGYALNSHLPPASQPAHGCKRVVPEMWILPRDSQLLPLNGTPTLMNNSKTKIDVLRDALIKRHGCHGEPVTAGSPHCQTWNCDTPVQLCTIPGGYGWIAGGWSPILGETPGKFPRAAEIWRFFREATYP